MFIRKLLLLLLVIAFITLTNNSFANEIGKAFIQTAHTQDITSLSISPDGQYFLSASNDHSIKLWDKSTGRLMKTFLGHSEEVTSVAYSPDGLSFVSASEDRSLKLWNINNGKIIRTMSGHEVDRYAEEESPKRTGHSHAITSVAYAPDGKHVLSGSYDGTLKYWNINTGKEIWSVNAGAAYNVAISPNGKYGLSGGSSTGNRFKLWRLKDGKLLQNIKGGQGDNYYAAAFTSDSQQILSGGWGDDDSPLMLWDIKSAKDLRRFKEKADLRGFSLSPNGKKVVTSAYGKLTLWDLKSGNKIDVLFDENYVNFESAIFTENNNHILFVAKTTTNRVIRLWDIKSKKVLQRFKSHSTPIKQVAFRPDGQGAVFGSYETGYTEGPIKYWDFTIAGQSSHFTENLDAKKLVFLQNGKAILSFGFQRLKLWDVNTAKLIKYYGYAYASSEKNYDISSNEKYAVLGQSNTLEIWDLKDSNQKPKLIEGTGEIDSIAFSPNGKLVLLGSDNVYEDINLNLRLWDIEQGKDLKRFTMKKGSIYSIAYSPDGNKVLSGHFARMNLWDVNTGKLLREFDMKGGDYTDAIAFSPDSRMVLSGAPDYTLSLWGIDNGQLINTFIGHRDHIIFVGFSDDGKFILSGSKDNTLKLWDRYSGKELITMASFSDGEWIALTPEGYFNASSNGAKHLNILTGPLKVSTIDQYYETFYRPDIVKLAFQGKTFDTGLSIATVKAAPLVTIVDTDTETNHEEATVTLKIVQQAGGIGEIRLYLNDAIVSLDNTRGLTRVKDKNTLYKKYNIKLNKGENQIRAIAFNTENTMQSSEALHNINANYSKTHKPSIYALVVGIDKYKNPNLSLNYSVADAQLFKQTIEQETKGLFDSVNVTLLTTMNETKKDRLIEEFNKMSKLKPNDMFIFYVASHGTVDDGMYYLITSNVGSTSTRKLKQNALSQDDIKNLIANIPTTKKFIVLDTCNSGALGNSIQAALLTRGMSESTAMKVLSRAVGSTVLSASTSQQEAMEGYKGHGLFTYVLTEGLKGKADANKDGFIKTTEIADYLDDEVPELAEKLFNKAQYPTVAPSGNAFPITKSNSFE